MSKGLFGGMFDFNRDGKLDGLERAAEFAFLNSMFEEEDDDDSDEEEDDFYVITDAGDEALYPHIRQFAEDLVTFMYDNEYECTDEEIQAFFKEKYEMTDDETVTLLALFMCNKLYHFGWDAPKIFSSEKGWFRRLEQLEGDDEE